MSGRDAAFAAKISETGGMRTNPSAGSNFSRLRRIPSSWEILRGRGRGFPEPGVRIRGIGAHWLHDRGGGVAPSPTKQTIHTLATLFSSRKATGEPMWASNLYIYGRKMIIYGREGALWVCQQVWRTTLVWLRTPAQFGNPVLNPTCEVLSVSRVNITFVYFLTWNNTMI